jgi:hypothetical protein
MLRMEFVGKECLATPERRWREYGSQRLVRDDENSEKSV